MFYHRRLDVTGCMTDFQRAASTQGRAFEANVRAMLAVAGAVVLSDGWTDPDSREQVDFVVRTSGGVVVWIEAKGSWKGKTPGVRRSDTAKKATANAWHLLNTHGADRPPYVLVTSHLPKPGTYSEKLLADADAAGLFTAVTDLEGLDAVLAAIDGSRAIEESVTGLFDT